MPKKIIKKLVEIFVVVFDIDGTTQDTFLFHLIRVAKFLGINITPDEYRSLHLVDIETDPKLKKMNWAKYTEEIDYERTKWEMEQFVIDVIHKLVEMGVYLFVCTSAYSESMQKYLDHNGVGHFFKAVLGSDLKFGDSNKPGTKTDRMRHYILEKYGLDSSQLLFVADTRADIFFGEELGAHTVFVEKWAFNSVEDLEGLNPIIISDLTELPAVVEELTAQKV
jgi:phosphoglycolate phosphatase